MDMHTIKPFDTQAVQEMAEKCGSILTLEEHSVYGGLGGRVAEAVSKMDPVPVYICGIPDEDVPNGTDQEVFHYYGMDTDGLKEKIRKILQKNKKTMTA